MKKLISIFGIIGLILISTKTIINCEKQNNNKNKINNKYKYLNSQNSPENSNWKLLSLDKLNFYPDNKWYIGIVKKKENENFIIIKFNFSNKSIWENNGTPYHIINGIWYIFKSYYYWNGLKEPKTPKINLVTGKIIDWKEKK